MMQYLVKGEMSQENSDQRLYDFLSHRAIDFFMNDETLFNSRLPLNLK